MIGPSSSQKKEMIRPIWYKIVQEYLYDDGSKGGHNVRLTWFKYIRAWTITA